MQQALTGPLPRFARRKADWKVIGLIGAGHASSHFFQLVLPTLLVPLRNEFGLSYAELGVLIATFYVISGIGQAVSGFVVDRIGSRPVLWFGLGCFVVSGCVLASAQGYLMLALAAAIAGLGNAVFHPVDFSILNQRVSSPRLGHAFSVHGVTGSVGWALTPIYVGGLAYTFGWRAGAVGAAALVAVVLALTIVGRRLLAELDRGRSTTRQAAKAAPQMSLWSLLANPVVWGAFLFFTCSSIALSAVQNYTVPILGTLYGTSAIAASSALSAYMACSAVGMFLGGFLVSSAPRSERIVAMSFVAAGGLLAILGLGLPAAAFAVPCLALAGFCAGIAGPSRDMLVRRVAPKGAIGSVYGLVGSGMDTGSAVAPLVFGAVLDLGWAGGPYLGSFAAFLMASCFAAFIAIRVRRLGQ